ncbi:DUF6776 family protein [Thalassotalea agarivorans]|uniref:Uncharacterized protein n=1 Tax=Thalassotalea agarivorans TaxID=349064 RepID=A0A1I0I0U2_THASX|nr:DUF6776 family protein [Thalassotalea agarivorans]SET90237.1 hypothetical protein SAMN05660429_03009 [Thalassotalea agarivorans]
MNWLAKIDLNIIVTKLGPLRSAILLIALIAACLFCGYRVGNFYHGYQNNLLALQKQRLQKLHQQQQDQQRHIHILETELEVERMANQRAQSTLKGVEKDYYQTKKELAFYEKVMAPEKQADGLVIDDFNIFKTESLNHYRFQTVLVQQVLKKQYAKGYIDIKLVGSLKGRPVTYDVGDVSEVSKKDLSFSFRYFQIIDGELTLPKDFKPEKVVVAGVLTQNSWQKYQRIDKHYPWSDLFTKS